MDNKKILQVVVLLIIAAGVFFLIPRKERVEAPVVNITDFDSCQNNGGQIIDGEPVKCVAPNGQTFEESQTLVGDVVVDMPQYGALVTSPLTVTGKARGTWFFEANIPVTLKDQTGKTLVQKGFQAKSDWMTTDYVPFEGVLEFTTDAEWGVLIIEKDNPSGLPENDAAYAVPVRFK